MIFIIFVWISSLLGPSLFVNLSRACQARVHTFCDQDVLLVSKPCVSAAPSVRLGSLICGIGDVDLSDLFEPRKSYLLSSYLERKFFTDSEAITKCSERVESF